MLWGEQWPLQEYCGRIMGCQFGGVGGCPKGMSEAVCRASVLCLHVFSADGDGQGRAG